MQDINKTRVIARRSLIFFLAAVLLIGVTGCRVSASESADAVSLELNDRVLTVTGKGEVRDTGSAAENWPRVRGSITEVRIDEGITGIGDSAFYGFRGMKDITIPAGVTSIQNSAFSYCWSLEEFPFPETLEYIGKFAFSYCRGLKDISLPEGVKVIDDYAFYFCSGLTDIALPEGVTEVGEYAFSYCGGLKSITIPRSVSLIGQSAFFRCTSLRDVYFGGTEEAWRQLGVFDVNGAEIHFTGDAGSDTGN